MPLRRFGLRSLRSRLVAATLVIQALLLGLLIQQYVDILGERLREQAQLRMQEMRVLLNASLSVPLAQVDHAAAQEILDEARAHSDIVYFRLYDSNVRLIAASGDLPDPNSEELPWLDPDISEDGNDGIYDQRFPITLAGQPLGTLYLGTSTQFLRQAQGAALRDGIALALLTLVLSAIVLALATLLLTRRLGQLAEAADAVSTGDFSVRLGGGNDDEVGRVVAAFNDMASSLHQRDQQLSASQANLLYLAERDNLTGLYNRYYLRKELARRLDEAKRDGSSGALLLFDLDEFKAINDAFGHQAGDEVLIRVASEVERLIRRNEVFCRLGGDEFVLIAPGASEAQIDGLAERIIHAIAEMRFERDNHSIRLSCSLGVALYPEHAADCEVLMSIADAAMYRSKQAGKNTWRLYEPELDSAQMLMDQLSWKERITAALERNQMQLHFQGIYAMPERRISHLEALLRMIDADTGQLLPPGQFIGIAEKLGLITQIDRWVIREAVRVLQNNPNNPPIAVNISGRSLDEPDLPEFIAGQLRGSGVDPLRLMIELTETAAVSDLADAERFIQALRAIGCVVCLDDFGSGFASFAYLKHIKADVIKIDGSFILDLPSDPQNQMFVRAMVEVARGLGVVTIAECVEDAATLDMLTSYGIDQVQGFHLDRPKADHPALSAGVA